MNKKQLVCQKDGDQLAYYFQNERLVMFKCQKCGYQAFVYREDLHKYLLPPFTPFVIGQGYCQECGAVVDVKDAPAGTLCVKCSSYVVLGSVGVD